MKPLLLALVVLGVAPAVSQAAIVDMYGNGQLAISDIDGEKNELAISFAKNTFLIEDAKSDLRINGGSDLYCSYPKQPDHRTVSCQRPGRRGKPKIQNIYTGPKADSVRIGRAIDARDIFGGPGDDDLRGNAHIERLNGEQGDDVVVGGKGLDRLYGGPGDDVIKARDGEKDGLITCGAGNDKAIIDASDPSPHDCEIVKRK